MASLKFPLKKEILLFTDGNVEFKCRIKYAGKDTLRCINVSRRVYNLDYDYFTSEYDDEIILERNKIVGYAKIPQTMQDNKLAPIINLQLVRQRK